MDEPIMMIAERYLGMLRQIEAIVLAIKGDLDLKKLVAAIQAVHLEQVRRCHDALQGVLPEDERKSFSDYLSGLAAVVKASEGKPVETPVEAPVEPKPPVKHTKPKKS